MVLCNLPTTYLGVITHLRCDIHSNNRLRFGENLLSQKRILKT